MARMPWFATFSPAVIFIFIFIFTRISFLSAKDVLHPYLPCAAVSIALASTIHNDVSKTSASSKPPLVILLRP
jgi:hypothetical protein